MLSSIKFKPETKNGFYDTVRLRAAAYFAQQPHGRKANVFLWTKSALFVCFFVVAYAQILTGTAYWAFWYALMGFLTVPLILNIGHEAVHGTFSRHSNVNKYMAYVFNLLGADADIWRKRHVYSHHVLPNIPGHDSDISQNKLARIAPNTEHLPAHRYQHWYMPFLYLIYTLNWLVYRDFKDVRLLFGQAPDYSKRIAVLVLSKVFYFGYTLVLPLLLFPTQRLSILGGFLLMQFVMSATTFLVLVSAHVGEDAVFPEPDTNGYIPHTWSEHQLITTTDFAPESTLVTHLFGGFNHHVVHHLFPEVSHVHYSALTAIVQSTAKEYGLCYHCFPSLRHSIVSHFRFLKKNSYPLLSLENADL